MDYNSQYVKPTRIQDWRMRVVYILIAIVFAIFVFRLFDLMITNGESFLDRAEENRTRNISVPTSRGLIYDRNGFVLARNVASYNVIITPALLPTSEGGLQNIYRELSEVIEVPISMGTLDETTAKNFSPCVTPLGIQQIVEIGDTNSPYSPIQIKCNIDETTARVIVGKSADWPGVDVEVVSIRDYPTGELTSEVIGFLGPIPAVEQEYYESLGFIANRDKVGYAGVEWSLQEIMGGTNGQRVVEVDVAGKILRDLETPIDPVPGSSVKLTIDTRLQSAAKATLEGEMQFWNTYLNTTRSSNGAVVALNPKTGEVLALVSYPTFENNRMARVIPSYYYEQLTKDPHRPLFNHAVSAEHPPGSVFKMASAIGILNEGVISPTDTIDCPGKISVVQKFLANETGTTRDFVCWNREGHNGLDFYHGVAESCNVFFYKVTGGFEGEVPEGLGIWRLGEYARALGYGAPSGIELPGESSGLIPDPNWKRVNVGENWSSGDTYIAGVGQGYVLATVLQVAMSFSTLANDGVLMQPTLVYEVVDEQGNVIQPFEPRVKWDITKDPLIQVYDENNFPTGEYRTVEPWVIKMAKEGMRLVVTEGTAKDPLVGNTKMPSAGKTGTAEYCDNLAQEQNRCTFGNWPTHAWYAAYAPYNDPEILVVAFVYNGGEGAAVAGPVVRKILDAYHGIYYPDATP
ncbi:MAG: penicillin-binding protein 2 [Chloroflexi bacterium]|nr:penicillin-binding protein 2 [Chloroflexota bacterium]